MNELESYSTFGPGYERKIRRIREKITTAIANRKIFSVHYYAITNFDTLRGSLERRGWMEIPHIYFYQHLTNISKWQLLNKVQPGNTYEKVLQGRLLKNVEPNFIWCMPNSGTPNLSMRSTQINNRVMHMPDLNFNSKEGLAQCVRILANHEIKGVAEMNVPRSYMLKDPVDRESFMDDMRRTACISLLLYVTENNGPYAMTGSIDDYWVEFALKRINEAFDNNCSNWYADQEWGQFFQNFQAATHDHLRFAWSTNSADQVVRANKFVSRAKVLWPNVKLDGTTNTWILKKWDGCCGLGLYLMNDAEAITKCVQNDNMKRFVVQKYIERPLLIYKTKFDIRQFFLLTNFNNRKRIWMYKVCYLRLCGTEFSMDNLDTAIHITNYSIQKDLRVSLSRSKMIPSYSMWSMKQLQNYLASIGQPNVWNESVYPTMRKNFIGAVLSSKNSIVMPNNSFNLYGCDYLITENFETFLLEINLSPGLNPSNPVNRYVLPMVVEDTIKVTVDHARRSYASTGYFEMVYEVFNPYRLVAVPSPKLQVQRFVPKKIIPRTILPLKPVKVYVKAFIPPTVRVLNNNKKKNSTLTSTVAVPKWVSPRTILPIKPIKQRQIKLNKVQSKPLKRSLSQPQPQTKNVDFLQTRFSKPFSRKSFAICVKKKKNLDVVLFKSNTKAVQSLPPVSRFPSEDHKVKESFTNLIMKTASAILATNSFVNKIGYLIRGIVSF